MHVRACAGVRGGSVLWLHIQLVFVCFFVFTLFFHVGLCCQVIANAVVHGIHSLTHTD